MSFSLEEFHNIAPYSLNQGQKTELYKKSLYELTKYHYEKCGEYKKIVNMLNYDHNKFSCPADQPMIPVRLFKEYDLLSVPKGEIVKIMTSSGTSNQTVSKIFLNKENTKIQTRALTRIIGSFIGEKRLPLLILDSPQVKTNREMFSARGAGVIGFSAFGYDVTYALDENMHVNIPVIQDFIGKYKNDIILFFGYTYMIWQFSICTLRKMDVQFNLSKGILFHIGGWKKLKDQAVDAITFNKAICDVLGNISVHNYYGMAEQLGSVFVECEYGHMHCSVYSDVFIRRYEDFSLADMGERGLIELISLLPISYPGHVLLTEDEGEILGEDDCPCGRLGKYFKIHGRVKGAEIRGCSDTYEQR
jgi:phenylacetate-coenzyme A ligase PaaK-like adenylate-forming protein